MGKEHSNNKKQVNQTFKAFLYNLTLRKGGGGGYFLQWPIRGVISLVEVHERVGKSVISLGKKNKRG